MTRNTNVLPERVFELFGSDNTAYVMLSSGLTYRLSTGLVHDVPGRPVDGVVRGFRVVVTEELSDRRFAVVVPWRGLALLATYMIPPNRRATNRYRSALSPRRERVT
jgi:hypothetical protein